MSEADRLRLAGRTKAQYDGFGYAPLLADDFNAVAAVANDIALSATLASTSVTEAAAQVTIATNSANSAANSANSANASAQAAAATIPILGDRTVGRRPSDTAIWSMLRATPAWGFGVSGNLEETPVDTARWEYDPATLAPLGQAFAGARTNTIRNPRGEGAPDTWVITAAPSGLTRTITTGVSYKGMTGVRVRYQGTPASSGAVSVAFDANTAIPAAPGQVWSGAFLWRLAGGSLSGVSQLRAQFGPRNSGGSSLSVISTTVTDGGGDNHWRGSATLSDPNTAFVQLLLRVDFAATPLDFSIDFFIPRLENAPFASAPILPTAGTQAASSRAQGNVTIPVQQLGTRWNRRQGIILLDWNSQPGAFTSAADADWFGLASWGDTTANERMGLLINPARTSVEARCTAGGVVQTASAVTITAPAAGVTTRAALAWDLDAGFLQVAARGTAGSKVALTALPVPGFVMPGRYATSNPLFGRIQGFDVQPAALFDASLAALTA